ncbi:MAG: hypothetical protein ACKE5M_00090 [Methylophilaceae bacterium]
MKIQYLLIVSALFVMLTGCASTGGEKPGQVARITPEELAKLLPPPIATVTLDDLVADSKQGKTPDEIIAKIKESHSRYELSSSQVLDLNKQGVDVKVLDYIQQSNELAKQNAIAEEMNRREKERAEVQKQLDQERLARHRYYDPYWGPRYNFFYGHPFGYAGRYRHGSRFGLGLRYGYPYRW